MTMLALQAWLLLTVAFLVGAVLAWLIIQVSFKPVSVVRDELQERKQGAKQ